MDLYEALKQGTTIEELTEAFYRDLDSAEARIEEEKAAAEAKRIREEEEARAAAQEYIELARENLADAMLEYAAALAGDFNLVADPKTHEIMMSTVEAILGDIEKNFIDEKNKRKSIKIKTKDKDADIIAAFLKTLK